MTSTDFGERDLSTLLCYLEPEQRPGVFVYCLLPEGFTFPQDVVPEMLMRESEGMCAILEKSKAEELQLSYSPFIASWITLTIQSSLDAIGLTAAISAALKEINVTCNVIAGLYHDHILVPVDQAEDAMDALRQLSAMHRKSAGI